MASDVVAVRVWPGRFQMEPGYLRITVTVPKHADNRRLDVVVDSGSFYRSTLVQLDGDTAPMTHQVEYRDVPAGRYVVAAVVTNAMGKERGLAFTEVEIISRHAD